MGLDISDTAVKVMLVERVGENLIPKAYAETPLSDAVINNHLIVNPQRLAELIRRTVDKAKIKTPYVVCSLPEAKSFVRVVTLPKMAEQEIDDAIPYELEADIPIPVDQVYLDWYILRELPDKLELLVTATPKDYIDSLLEALHLANLRPLAMELESQATARALTDELTLQKTVLIVDLATKQASFIIVDKGVIEYTSSIPLAGNALTESIAASMGVGKSDAEQMKRRLGLLSSENNNAVRSAILPILDQIIDEIKNVVRFFEEHNADHRAIGQIILCGGTAHLLGVSDYVSTRINLGSSKSEIRVVLGSPFVKLTLPDTDELGLKKEQQLALTTVLGLALRDIDYEPRYT